MKFTDTAFLLVLLSISTNAARTTQSSNPCSMKCSQTRDSMFLPGQTYTYSYEGESNIKTLNGAYDSTGIMIKSKIKVTGLSDCEMKFSMTEVEVLDKISKDGNTFTKSPDSEKIKQIVEQNEVFFTRENEEVKSICMNKDEPIWSENMKKVIIDNIANQKFQYEYSITRTTSHGTCLQRRENLSETSSVTTTYDIESCQNKKISQSIFGELTKIGLFHKAQVTCTREYEGKIDLKSVQCREEYKITSFKQNMNQIAVEIKMNLVKETQVQTDDKTFADKNLFRTGIEQSEDDFLSEESTYSSAKLVLKEICEQQVASVFSTIPKLFMKLINLLKNLNSKEFKELYLDVVNNNICTKGQSDLKSLFYDAIGFVSTPAATSVMVDLIKSNKISSYDQNVWLTSLSFMQQTPTMEMLKDLESLMSTETLNTPMYLGISAVTHLFCKANYQYCLNDPLIQNIISKFLKNLNNDCSLPKDFNQDHLSKMQISLKALGNLKVFNKEVTAVLNKCISTATNPASVRVSALEVMKHMGCEINRQVAMDVFENNENDSELRINAYLTVMGCPDANTLFKVRKILEKEKVNQVGSFIWTHLTNIKESRDILKINIKELLEDVKLKKVFDISKLKFSRNIEKTLSSNKLGMTFDSNIIFSEKSFIPRSVSLNTTAMILDRPSNFIELSARLEGLEDLLYKLFGPQGYLKKDNNAEDNLALIQILNEINGNMDIKLYGQQVSFIELARGSLGSIKKYNIIEELLSWTQDKSIEINKNLQLVDKSAVFPTMLGFPLKFQLQSSTSVNIKIKSKLDVSGLFAWPVKMNIENHISPNINAELNADLILQTPFTKYGMKLNLKSGTNTEFKASIHASNNEEFSIKFDTPKWKQNLLSVEGNSYVIHRDNELIQLQDKLTKQELCTSYLITNIFGVKACAELKLVSSEFRKQTLLFGPFSANIFIEKQDTQTGYELRGSSKIVPYIAENGAIYSSRFINFEFNTPKTNLYDRRYYGNFALDFKQSFMKFEFRTPWNHFSIMNTYKLTKNEKKIGLNIQMNKKDVVDISAEYMKFNTPKGMNLKGGVTVSVLTFQPYKTKWSLDMTSKQWIFNFLSTGFMKDDTKINLKIVKVESTRELSLLNKYDVSGFYKSYFGNGMISGIANENYYGHRWDIKVIHKDKSQKEFSFRFRHKIEDKSSKNLMKYFLTTTFAYGEKGENFIKLKTENEMSRKHVRTSVKVSYGQNEDADTKLVEEIDLNLYGGYTLKDDDKYYQEGSLSFKFPTKNLHYEGRYNAEIGRRMFKVSLALDKDQQSQLNLKVNYVQPELYLKNTDCEIAFSIPESNLDLKWSLKEVDVNKYKYSLAGQYNNFDLRIDGVQTQISKLDHDSSLTIKMPHAAYLPKHMNINLRINLVDFSKSTIYGSIEIPDRPFKYSIETQFSYTPQNLFQISSSDISSVFKYDLKLSNSYNAVKSKFIFTCNPEEFQTHFRLNMDKDDKSDNQIEFDLHAMHKKPNYKLINNMALIMIRYPGNKHSLSFKSEFKYKEMMAQLDILWNRDRKISISTMYELEDRWTQKGLRGSLTIKTPFNGFELTHFGVNAVGQLRYRKVDFEFKWGANKKILFDIIIEPKSSNDFTFSWKLVTPFQGMSLVSFNAKHLTAAKSINTQANLEIGPSRRYQVKFEAIDNSEGKMRDYKVNVLIESGIYPSIKISAFHKDDSVHFKTQFDAAWKNTESLVIKSDISYTRDENEIVSNGNVELLSTLFLAKQMKAIWLIENRDNQFTKNIQILHDFNNIFKSELKGFYELEPEPFKLEFSGSATLLKERSVKIASTFNYKSFSDIRHRFTLSRDTVSVYSHNLVSNFLSQTGYLKVLIPNTEYRTIELSKTYFIEQFVGKSSVSLKIGEKYLFNIEEEYITTSKEINYKAKISSDYTKWKNTQIKSKWKTGQSRYYSTESEITLDSESIVQLSVELDLLNQDTKCKVSMKSKYELLKKLDFNFEHLPDRKDRFRTIILGFSINDDLKFNGKLSFRRFRHLNVDLELKHYPFERYLKLQYDHHLMGYEHIFETNIFDRKVRLVSSVQSRGGFTVQAKLENLWLFQTLEVLGKFSKDTLITIIYQQPYSLRSNEKIKLFYSNSKGVQELSLESSSYFDGKIKLDLLEFKTMFLEFKVKTIEPKLEFQFNYEGGKQAMKHSSQIIFISGNEKVEFKNKLEKVKWKYLLIESELNSSWKKLQNFKVGFEYRVRPNRFILDFKAFLNEKFIKLSTNLNPGFDTKMELKIETSFTVLKEINFALKQKHNERLTQVKHHCKAIVKSCGNEFQLENDIEWSSLNFMKVESSLVVQTSEATYFIEPKSLKFVHHIISDTFKDSLEIQLGKDKNLKLSINIPMKSKTKMQFEFESFFEQVKKLSVDFDLDHTQPYERIYAVTLQKNHERLLFLKVQYEARNRKFSLSSNLELFNTRQTNFELNFIDDLSGDAKLKVKFFDSIMKDPINFDATLNYKSSKLTMSLDGRLIEKISAKMELTPYKAYINIIYGRHVLLIHIVNKDIQLIKVEITTVINIKFEYSQGYEARKLSGSFEDNSIAIVDNYKEGYIFDAKVLGKSLYLVLKNIQMTKWTLNGKSNFKDWSVFSSELEISNSEEDLQLKAGFTREMKKIMNIFCQLKFRQYLRIEYTSIYETLKSAHLRLNYDKAPEEVSLEMKAESFGTKFVTANYKIDKKSFKGEVKSSFEWMKEFEIEGQLKSEDNEITGTFSLKHNKLEKSIAGKFILKIKGNLVKLEVKTPFSDPYDEMSFTLETSNKLMLIEFSSKEKKFFSCRMEQSERFLYQADIEVFIPKSIKDLTFSLKLNIDAQSETNSLRLVLNSNLFKESTLEIFLNSIQNRFKIKYSSSSKESQFDFGMSQFQTFGTKIELITQHGDDKNSVELWFDFATMVNIYLKTRVTLSSFVSSPLKFESKYEHKANYPQTLFVNAESKVNDKTVFLQSINIQRQSDNSVDLLGKLILSTNEKEYENKIELFYKHRQKFSLIISSPEILNEEIEIRVTRKLENLDISWKLPFELIKLVEFSIRVDRDYRSVTQAITLNTNKLGKYEIISECKMASYREFLYTSQINTPSTNRKIYGEIQFKYTAQERLVKSELIFDENVFNLEYVLKNKDFSLKLSTPFEVLKRFELVTISKLSEYEADILYNHHKLNSVVIRKRGQVSLKVQSNSIYFKTMSMSIQVSPLSDLGKLTDIELTKDDQSIKMAFQTNFMRKSLIATVENDLVLFLPKQFSGKFQYSLIPVDIVIDLKTNDVKFFKLIVNKDQFLFNTKIKVFQSSITETKIHLSENKIELILLTDSVFSVLITRTSLNQIDGAVMLNGNQYSLRTKYETIKDTWTFKLSTYRNAVDELLEINNEIDRFGKLIALEVKLLSDTILKFKLQNSQFPNKISLEAKILSFNGVADWELKGKPGMVDAKVSWNVLYKNEQLLLGSVELGAKYDRPLKYLLNVNFQQMAFQAKLMESEKGEFTFELIGPYKSFDTILKWNYMNKPDEYELWWSLNSNMIGEYSTKTTISLNKDPELNFMFSSTSPIVRYNLKMITSIPKEFSVKTEFRLFDWEKIAFTGKLSTKDLLELIAVLETPFSSVKQIEVKKTINYISFFEQKYETTITYNGYRKLQYVGGHEIYWSRNIFKLQSSFHRENVRIISLDVDHSGNHKQLDHSCIWYIRDKKFGFRLNGGFNPLFEGKSEIYTPFHEKGKLVVMGKQMETGVLIEAGKGEEKIASFEYLSEKDIQSMRITPPSNYGKPLFIKYRNRRYKRSADDNIETEVMYGIDSYAKLSAKYQIKQDKYVGFFNIAAPKFTTKSAELSLSHYNDNGAWKFDHNLKIKDSIHRSYRIFGNLFRENTKNFKISLNTEHPDFGLMHLALGHSLTKESYDNHFLMKLGDQTILNHNMVVKYNFIKPSFTGEWITKIYSHDYKLNVNHNGEWDEFKQNVVMTYNNSPFWQYRSHFVPKQRSVIEMEIPRFDTNKIVVTIDREKNEAEISWTAKSINHVFDIINKNGQLLAFYKRDNENVASLLMKYNERSINGKANYLQHSGSIGMNFQDSVLSLKAESNFMKMKKATMEISKNKLISEVDYLDKLYTVDAQYEYKPDNFNFILKSSIKEMSEINFNVVPNQLTLKVNNYYQTIRYIVKPNHVQLQGENNIFKLKTFDFDLKFQPMEKATVTLNLNSFTSKTKLEYSKDEFLFQNENNYFLMKSLELRVAREIKQNLKYYQIVLSANQNEKLKMKWEMKNQLYGFELKTFLGQHVVISFDQKSNRMITNLKNNENYLNIMLQLNEDLVQSSKTYTMKTSVESTFAILQKVTNEFSYTITDDEYRIQSKLTYNGRSLQLNGQLSKSKVFFYIKKDETMYEITATLHSANNLVLEIVIPNHKMNIEIKKEKNQYLLDIKCDKRDVFMVRVNQDLKHKYGIEHKSLIEYYGRPIWDFSFNSNSIKHEIKMNTPVKIDASVTIFWKESEETKLAFLLKLSDNRVMGAGIKYLFTSQSSSYEVHIENYLYVISLKREMELTTRKLTELKLVNKNTKKQWELKVQSIKGKSFELLWKTPSGTNEIKYNQIIVNNVITKMELEALGNIKIQLELTRPDVWKGYLILFSERVVAIEIGKDYGNAIINEAAPENQRIILKYVASSKGEWKKNYKSIKQLVVVQKALNINFDVLVETRMENTLYSTFTTVKYQAINGQMKTLKLGSSIDFSKYNKVTIEVENPIAPIKTVLYRFQPDKVTLRYEMRTTVHEKNKIDGYFELKTGSNPGITAKLHYNPADPMEFFQIHSKYIDDRQMETHAFFEKNEIKTTYFQFLLRLLNEHHIETTFSMKSRILFRISRFIIQVTNNFGNEITESILSESQWMKTEILFRTKQISNIIPIVKDLEKKIRIHIIEFIDEIFKAFYTNQFYIYKIVDFCRNIIIFLDNVSFQFIEFIGNLEIKTFEFLSNTATIIQNIQGYLCLRTYHYVASLLYPYHSILNIMERMYLPEIQKLFVFAVEDVISYSKRVLTNAITFTRSAKRLINSFFLSSTYKLLENAIEIIKNTIGKLMEGSLDFLKYEEGIKTLYNELIDNLERTLSRLHKNLRSILNQADDNLSFVMGDNYFQNLGQILSMMSDELIQFLKNENNQKVVRNAVMSSMRTSIHELTNNIHQFAMKLVWPYYVVLDQKINSDEELKMTLRLTSPVPINDLKSLPDMAFLRKKIIRTKFLVNYLRQMGNKFALSMSRLQDIAKWFYITIPPMTSPSILPEFESYATVSKTSIVTFDKKVLELNTDKCRILLSKDLLHKKWEIILNQENKQKSYTVKIGQNSITISGSDYKVTLNGKPTELPLEIGSTTLVGLGRVMKLKDDNLGLAITIDPLNEIFTVGISGWYHGRVRGLFGNSDNEPFNDLMLDNGKIVSNDVFTKSYNENGQSCNLKVQTKEDLKPVHGCPYLKKLVCKFLYKCPWSPLAACFEKIDPTNFFHMCLNSQEELQLKYDPTVCNSARQYQSQCLQAGVQISVPIPCQRCEVKNDKPLTVNESRTMKVNKKVSDIVLIVDEGHCLNSLKPKLPRFISDLEKEMNSKGMDSVRFGLVTYVGNEKNSARFHTVGQKMLGTSEEMLRSLEALRSSIGQYKDVIGAITQAYEYPFSDHSSKHIIMISCQSINELPSSFQTMADKFQQKGIHFSLLTDFSFKLKDNKKAVIFGVDSKYVYTSQSTEVDKGSTIRPVNDFLYKLAMQVKGIVFDYKFLISNQQLTEKRFTSSLVTQISLRATPARSAKCTCIEDGFYNCVPLDIYTIFPVTKMN